MNTTPDPEELGRAAALRRRAEAEYKSKPDSHAGMSASETREALHELRVHQIELEMQNDELQKTQASLEEARSQYFELYDQAPVGYFTLGGDGNILRVNSTMAKLVGSTKQALLKQAFTHFVLPADQDVLYRHRKHLLETGAPQEFELRLKRPDEAHPWVLLHAALAHDAEGAAIIRVAAMDITERKLAVEALRESEKLLSESQRIANIGNWVWDLEGPFKWSPQAYSIYGESPEAFTPTVGAVVALAHPDDRQALEVWLSACKSGQAPDALAYRSIFADGMVHDLSWQGGLVPAETDESAHMAGTIQDVTARAQLEAQLRQSQKMEAVGQLAGGVAHDFNNMLHIILGYTSLLREGTLAEAERDGMLKTIEDTAVRAAKVTQQLLAFSRRQIIEPIPLNLNDLIEDTVRMYERLFNEKIAFRFWPIFNLGMVFADKVQIEQVLMNLCLNARDAMPEGGELTIAATNVDLDAAFCRENAWAKAGPYVLVSVADTGVGMTQELQQKIFEPFFTTKKFGESSGLGLAMAYGIVTQHKGMIVVDSEPGKGSVFKIYLPRSAAAAPMSLDERPVPPAQGGTETILIAEDEEPVRHLLKRMLGGAGYTVLAASDGEEAVRLFGEHADAIQLVLLDIAMPKRNGREAMEAIQVKHPRMRFVFSSGYSDSDIDTDFVLKEGVRLVAKPYSRIDILRAVRESLDARPGESVVPAR